MLHYDAYWVSASHRNVARATKQILDLLQVTTLYFSRKSQPRPLLNNTSGLE